MHVEANFLEDLRVALVARLRRAMFKVSNKVTVEAACAAYFNLQKRYIPRGARLVLRSRKIASAPYPKWISAALGRIAAISDGGGDLNPYQSDTLRKPTLNDALLNDWGIHHLHLGEPNSSGYFTTRTSELLYVLVGSEHLYFIDVRHHGASFTDKELLEIVHQDWPEAIASYRAPGASRVSLTDDQRRRLRKKNAQTLVEMSDGTVYIGPGGGMMADGSSFEVRLRADRLMGAVHGQQELYVREASAIRNALLAQRNVNLDRLKLRLVVEEGTDGMLSFSVQETQSQTRINLNEVPPKSSVTPVATTTARPTDS
jgi:hypothetical protein